MRSKTVTFVSLQVYTNSRLL